MVYAQPSSCPEGWRTQTPMGLWNTNRSPNLGKKTTPHNNQKKKKKRTCKIVAFAVSADHRIKLKENEKKDECLDLARELKRNYTIWRWRLYQSSLVHSVQKLKGLLKRLEDWEIGRRAETIQTEALLRAARILRRVEETSYHSNSSKRSSADADVKNSKGLK